MTKNRSIQISLLSLLTVVLGATLVWMIFGRPLTAIDDADIFFVYARNVSAGHGFVYNVGGEFVEGFTSLLWTLICAGFFTLFHSIELPLFLLNLVLGALTLRACLRRTEQPVLFLLLLASVPAWFAWCQVTLMETGLWCLLITLLTLAVVEQRRNMVLALLPLLVITRPESMLWGAWFVVVFTLGKNWRAGVLPLVVLMVSIAGLVTFRMGYFGYPVPNTFYAKVSQHWLHNIANGLVYLLRYLTSSLVVLPVVLLWLGILIRGPFKLNNRMRMALCLLPGMGIPVLVGGDHFGSARFYQPLWPLLCLLAASEWPVYSARLSPKIQRRLPIILLLIGWAAFPFTANLKHEFRIAKEGREHGTALTALFQDLDGWPSVGVITAGGIKYTYPGMVYDLMGLNATEMAHAPGSHLGYKNHAAFNREVFYRWSPDILLYGDSMKFDEQVLKGLFDEARFADGYTKTTLHRNGAEVSAYFKKDFLMHLPKNNTEAKL